MRLIHAVSLVRIQVPRPLDLDMLDLGAKFRRLKYKLKHGFFMSDNMVVIIGAAMCLIWTFQSIQAMTRNFELTERLRTEHKSLELLKIEVEMAELENEYYKTDEYQELLARKYADKQLAGEHMVYLPTNSEEAINKHKVATSSKKEKESNNFEKWMMYLFPNR